MKSSVKPGRPERTTDDPATTKLKDELRVETALRIKAEETLQKSQQQFAEALEHAQNTEVKERAVHCCRTNHCRAQWRGHWGGSWWYYRNPYRPRHPRTGSQAL